MAKNPCTNQAEWRVLRGKAADRLSPHYHLPCDFGSAVMSSWEKGGVAPIYLCESHATEIGKNSLGVMAITPQSVHSNSSPEQPKSPFASVGPANAQAQSTKQDAPPKNDLAVAGTPAREAASSDSAKASATQVIDNVTREDFETYRTALQGVTPSTAAEERRAERADLERVCVSRYGERCTFDPTVHCPKCGRWFCDAHGEDEKWHPCALTI